ncbi:hypothetical protein [Cyanobium sp. NS01]|uniref:hypothetical protein n=1 Tax=Cyanobium sp. NS01 TaxID=261284 RepID=UPI0016474393|nr:hypothetical protein [Cyanobium sp. NS01]QNI69372.1 hypothetical protein CyaNS01_00212 [Cyanobium sp. NS01]
MQLVIPTLWKSKSLVESLNRYLQLSFVERILLVDNAALERPGDLGSLAKDARLLMLPQHQNIYVNPSWNLAVAQISDPNTLVGILNDDVSLSPKALAEMNARSWQVGEVVGLMPDSDLTDLSLSRETGIRLIPVHHDVKQSIGQQLPGFGSAMFLLRATYRTIPPCFQIWYGDDWLLRSATRIFGIHDPGLRREHHVTMRDLRKSSSFRSILSNDRRSAAQLFGFEQ